MTIFHRLEQWKERGVLSPEQHALLGGLARGEPISLFLELNILLYGGILAFVAGLGWTVSTWSEQLGDVVVLTVLSAMLAACFWYCFSRAPAWSVGKVPAPSLVFDYVLYLASLVWTVELAYIESRLHVLSGQWDLYLLATAGLFFFLAYRFDNRFVLSLALSSLAGWFGLTLSRWPSHQEDEYRLYAILYSLLVGAAGAILQRRGVKPHFFGTYLNIAANVLFWVLLSGVFQRQGYFVWLLGLLAACGASLAWGLTRRQFSFVAYAAVYGYIGVSAIVLRDMNDGTAILSYFLITGIAMLVMLVVIARRFGEGCMRAYSASYEEALRARDLLKDWAGEGFITAAQYQSMEQETVCDLRRTNIFLRVVLFLATLLIVGAAVGLFFVSFLTHAGTQAMGIFMLISAAIAYAAAEIAVSRARLYRFGIEEALAAGSVGLLCGGMDATFFSGAVYSPTSEFLVPAAGVIASIWIWYRFGLPYAPLAAMIFAVWVPRYWGLSQAAQHVIVAALYAAGLLAVAFMRRGHRFTYLDGRYSIAEALLWLGIYLEINLRVPSVNVFLLWWGSPATTTADFSRPFYWATWVLIWCLPPVVLARGVRQKDRFVFAAGSIAAILTLVTNKPYLGWERHTWDPMLLGALLIGVAIFLRRWLAKGPGEVRRGFTAQRLSGKDQRWMNAGATAFGLVSPNIVTPNMVTPSPQTSSPDVHFGGGDSGGGGASSDF